MKNLIVLLSFLIAALSVESQASAEHNLVFDKLATRWDDAMPLGNGMLGALVWEKQKRMRLSLDRADLWDERKALDLSKFNFKWVEEQVLRKDYGPVQQLGDKPYDLSPYPTKLPAAALEFDINNLGKIQSNSLDIASATNTIIFEKGVVFRCYIHATKNVGYFSFQNLPGLKTGILHSVIPNLVVHGYSNEKSITENDNSHAGEGLEKLGYAKGKVIKTANSIHYRQPTYDGHYYTVHVEWKSVAGNKIIGSWTIDKDKPAPLPALSTSKTYADNWNSHKKWWEQFWSKSSVTLPDKLLEKQYYLEMYKLGSVSRKGAPAITLQAVWTADNGSLPPWKGDFHNDLNTQLSYWPAYTGNRLEEAATFTDWLWKIRFKNKQYTKQYFGVMGLNVPGVVTLNGDPMGGWIQYSLSPTVVAWCAQHLYWQWKYSMDKAFLATKAYPYIHEAAVYLQNITRLQNGIRKLPLSSSPEYNNNDISAWFTDWSNFDLSLAKFLFTAAGEVALATGRKEESDHWKTILLQLPSYEVNETGFTIAPGLNLNESHRHMSQYMAIYPLALLDINDQPDKIIIENSLRRIEEKGTRAWCGYSFSWMASLYARAYKADSAVRQLQIFATNFCSPNSFHLNGDQKGGQYSDFTYRPFTLEGNFAFAQGIHELLLQSRKGYIQVFPATPSSWKNVSFSNLRAEGAFLISGKKVDGGITEIKIISEKGGKLKCRLPFKAIKITKRKKIELINTNDGSVVLMSTPGEIIILSNGDE